MNANIWLIITVVLVVLSVILAIMESASRGEPVTVVY